MAEITTLDNGFRVATREMKETEAVSLGLWVKAGSRYESPQKNGISHFLEHMAFKGTKTRTAQEIAESFDAIGGAFNAGTGREYTTYYAKVLKEHFHEAADIIADIILNSTFDKEELSRERGVILQEIAMTNDTPDDVLFEHYQETAFPKQPIGRSILGPEKHIETFQREDFVDYMADYYTAPNMILAVAGNITHDTAVAFAEKAFGHLPSNTTNTADKASYCGGSKTIKKPLEQVHLALGWQGVSYLDERIYQLQIASAILGGTMSSRLFQEIREKRGLAYHISAFTSNYCDSGLFTTYAGCAPDKVSELLPVLIEELQRTTHSIKEEELIRAKTQIRAALLMGYESSNFCADELGRHLICFDRLIPFEETMQKIEAITTADLHTIIAEVISNSNFCFSAIGDLSHLPEVDKLTQSLRGAA